MSPWSCADLESLVEEQECQTWLAYLFRQGVRVTGQGLSFLDGSKLSQEIPARKQWIGIQMRVQDEHILAQLVCRTAGGLKFPRSVRLPKAEGVSGYSEVPLQVVQPYLSPEPVQARHTA